MDWITDLVKLFLDNTYKIKHKLSLFLTVSFLIVLADNHLGISRHLYNKNKIEEIAQIETLLGKQTTSKDIKPKLVQLENEIVEQKNILGHFLDALSSIDSFSSLPNNTIIANIAAKPIEYSITYHVISSSFWILIFMVAFIGLIIRSLIKKDKDTREFIKELLQILAILILSSVAISGLLFLIPKYNPPFANYLINFLITTCIISTIIAYLFYIANNDLNKKYEKITVALKKLNDKMKPTSTT